jgi:hypothetical protein
MWREGATGRGAADRLEFALGIRASGLAEEEFGELIPAASLDFRSPVVSTAAGPVDGNSSEFQSRVTGIVAGLSIDDGDTFWIRWSDIDIAGSDDGSPLTISNSAPMSCPPFRSSTQPSSKAIRA